MVVCIVSLTFYPAQSCEDTIRATAIEVHGKNDRDRKALFTPTQTVSLF